MDALADRIMRGPRGRRLAMELLSAADERAREAIFYASRVAIPAVDSVATWHRSDTTWLRS